jgi:hypothetical protein
MTKKELILLLAKFDDEAEVLVETCGEYGLARSISKPEFMTQCWKRGGVLISDHDPTNKEE